MKTRLAIVAALLLAVSAAAQRTVKYYKTAGLGPNAVAVACLDGSAPGIARANNVLILSCGVSNGR